MEDMNSYMKKRYHARRKSAIEYLGNKCVECGSNENLHFHHIDPSTKLFTIAKGSSFSEERFWAEVKKCQLLCNTCHDTHHASKYKCGTPQRYWRGCKCNECKAAVAKHHQLYKQRRKEHLNSDI